MRDVVDATRTGALDRLRAKPVSSAQLRHLLKPEYGGFVVDKQRRAVDEVARGEVVRGELGPVWEYRLQRGLRMAWTGVGLIKRNGGLVVRMV